MGARALPVALRGVRPLDAAAAEAARARQAQLLKPPGSLGRLEELAVWLAGCVGDPLPAVRARVVVAAADHGVAAEGVSAFRFRSRGRWCGRSWLGGRPSRRWRRRWGPTCESPRPAAGAVALGAAAAAGLACGLGLRRVLGGVTGDTFGAVNKVTELAAYAALAGMWGA